jgi:hypothetical protein
MGPSTAHELAIARIVDQYALDDGLRQDAVPQIIGALRFTPSDAEIAFLTGYLAWRIANPILK